MSGGREKDMLTFLQEAELEHYYTAISRDLHVSSVTQIKYVEDDDLLDIGMSRPEMRRLRKFYNKACPKGFGKLRKILSTKAGNDSTSPDASSYPRSPQISRSLAESSPLIPPDAVTAYKTLGDGEFAIVQQGIWTRSNGERLQVALKCIRLDRMETPMSQFAKEAKELMSADHDHILPIYGVVCGVNSLSMVMELAPLRSLLECLKEPSLRNTFHVVQLCQFSCQIADGMRYLESRKIVHRDLAARNVLVFAKDKVKVSDASLTQALGIGPEYYQSNININLKLPIAWCAPECIHEQKFTCASDVWAYGVTLWEMFSYGFQPWAAFTGDQVLEAIDEPSCHRLEQPDACPSNYYNLMMQCWSHSVDLRPKFSVILSRLHEMQPERVQAMRDGSGLLKPDQLILRAQDIITVLDKQAPELGMWKGVMENGKVGYFESSMVAPFVELRNGSPAHRTKSAKVTRKESARKSMQKGGVKKLSASMISGPKNDLRHTGHIGYDGAVFGDVSFIGNNYDKLPVKVGATHNPLDEMSGSTISLPVTEKDRASVVASAQARLSYISVQSRTDVDSVVSRLSDSDTLTDVSSMVDDMDGLQRCKSEEQVLDRTYTDITTEDFGDEDFGDFKLPDLSTDMGFDLGPSFMDEVMKALDTGKPEPSLARPVEAEVTPAAASRRKDSPNGISNSNHHGLTSEKSPLIVAASPDHCVSASTFDNIALASEDFDSVEEDSVSSSRGSCASQLKDSGIMESSFGSLEISDYSKLSEDSPFKEEEKKRSSRPKLKLIMPSRGESSKKEGIQPMSASDEKLLNDAIDLANEYDQLHNADNMSPIVQPDDHTLERLGASPTSAEPDRLDSSWTSSKFGLRKKSPREERRSFTDEMASRPVDMNEELTPEAQEAYNMLVVKGTSKERDSFKAIRERRMNRAMFPSISSTDTDVNSALGARNGRASNLNIRKPQGIPTRGVGLRTASENSPEVQDTNPLRRLRESQSASTKPRSLSSHSELVNGQQAAGVSSVLHHPNLNPNMSFFDKLKEQEMANGDQPQQPLQQQQQQEGTSNVPSNPLPVPPRVPLRTSTVNAKPRERKHMLDLGSPKVVELSGPSALEHVSVTTVSGVVGTRSSGLSTSTEARRTHREGDDNVFTESKSCFVFPGAQELSPVSPLERPFSLSSNDSQLSINVKSVTASAHDLGIDDHSDSFWLQKINFEELVAHDFDPAMVEDENAPIPGRYKTSDTVSYEDLMEFALDGPHPRDTDFSTICDEVRLMRRILSKDVRLEDCMCALEETGWDVHSAIKLLKLKQLLSLGLGDQDWCKTALMRSKWSINEAANYLLTNLSGSDSPDLIHV